MSRLVLTRRVASTLALLVSLGQWAYADLSAVEARRIDRLILAVATHQGATFIRNGKAYKAADAATFLRGKFDKLGQNVTTAEQFVAQVASRSSTSGLIYQVRTANGTTVPSEVFLLLELQRIDAR